jgi:hypothetical protein
MRLTADDGLAHQSELEEDLGKLRLESEGETLPICGKTRDERAKVSSRRREEEQKRTDDEREILVVSR